MSAAARRTNAEKISKDSHAWQFRAAFRRHALGWRGSSSAVERLRKAVAEITVVSHADPALAADGAALLIGRISPAFEQVDGSSGALGAEVDDTIRQLAQLIGSAPLSQQGRQRILDRVWSAFLKDEVPYLEDIADHWGTMCASAALASDWADKIGAAIESESEAADGRRSHIKEEFALFSALIRAKRFDEVLHRVRAETRHSWLYRQWGFKALVAQGKNAEALRYAQVSENSLNFEPSVARACEELLLASGLEEEAYTRYAMRAADYHHTNIAKYRGIAKKYPNIDKKRMLIDLVAPTLAARANGLRRQSSSAFSNSRSNSRIDRLPIRRRWKKRRSSSKCRIHALRLTPAWPPCVGSTRDTDTRSRLPTSCA